ncbi:MAG: hypothetical protein ACREFS_13960 [Acetobacteraceae bacterium]
MADEPAPALAEELPVALPEAVELPVALPEAVPLNELVDVGGELVPGVEGDEDGEHAATATVRMAKAPKPLTASFALSTVPAMVPRAVM